MTRENTQRIQETAGDSIPCPVTPMQQSGTSKHELLSRLSEQHGCATVEYDEGLTASQAILRRLDVDMLRSELWMPITWTEDSAEVIACDPGDPELVQRIRETLGVETLEFRVTTRADLVRLIENSGDLNEHFPVTGGRTPLAKVRTYLAVVRTRYAEQRTQFARSRTGLALTRTGIAFISIAVAFLRFFGGGELLFFEVPLLAAGIAAIINGLIWYLPARKETREIKPYSPYEVPKEYSAIEISDPGGAMNFDRSEIVETAEELRREWDALSPVERRRFLANDRTDLAEERTVLAYLRSMMAKARTGLAFARTGIAFAGVGIGFIRHFHPGPWSVFDWGMIAIGTVMLLEGFYWYLPGRHAANAALDAVNKAKDKQGPWDLIFPSLCLYTSLHQDQSVEANSTQAKPGVWATTGLALERTTLADKRNGMSRLRTVMARARTGMAFIRTGFAIMSVGAGLFIYFGGVDMLWRAFDIILIVIGLYLIADGLHWYLPAERIKRKSPFCAGDFEIADSDYSEPKSSWNRVTYRHDN